MKTTKKTHSPAASALATAGFGALFTLAMLLLAADVPDDAVSNMFGALILTKVAGIGILALIAWLWSLWTGEPIFKNREEE